jgi:hypothetical protein
MNTNPTSRKDLICKKLGDEAMLYDPTNENVHVLNTTSLFIWNLLDGKNNLSDIEKKMRENFTISPDVNLLSDITKTISDFQGKGLLG